MNDVSIMIITHDLELARPVEESILPFKGYVFHAPNYPSFSKVCNDAIAAAKHEIVIICSRKVRPTPADIRRMLNLINDGYGLVALYSFAFFGFRKELIRRVGFFDERYIRGEYEDCDMVRRISEANIAIYEERSINYTNNNPTVWDNVMAKAHFAAKWDESWDIKSFTGTIHRKLCEEKYNYELGPGDESIVFKGREHSTSHDANSGYFYRNIRFI
jgi:hypothetical protein